MRLRAVLLAWFSVATTACSFSAEPMVGQQCAPPTAAKRCPDGFVCLADNRCWKPDAGPTPDGPRPDGPADMGPVIIDAPPFEVTPSRPQPSGNRVVPGGRV